MADDNATEEGVNDTAHLYEGKRVSSAPPSRRKVAGRLKSSTKIPKDAIPEVHVPTIIESFFGGPIVNTTKFLPPDRMVASLQMGSAGALLILCILTFMVTPVSGTAWFALSNMLGWETLGGVLHLIIILSGLIGGLYGIFQRDQRALVASYALLILVTLRFAGSKVDFGIDFLPEGEIYQKMLLLLYAVFLVMYMELTSGIIRFSMLDTSIRTGEVYVMQVTKITSRYHKSLLITPVIAASVAGLTLLINLIIPAFVGIFDDVAAMRLRESVELTSVYGVALGTVMVFTVIAAMFAVNLPLRIQQMREKNA
ncbi:MAG TPA: hypothetical protein EYQ15_02570 [Candidatus Poseidoniales archaeon]|nr:MAG: hypothetical protein CXT65_05525 [Euryarchaeota archaeon]HIG38181.1 hypothetical protein [Candidatus Poseidoniales archaeon]HIL43585.1 hypothetical protein [Candidatus Poseidoniales archaeon]